MKIRAVVFAAITLAAILFSPVLPCGTERGAEYVFSEERTDPFCFDSPGKVSVSASAALLMEAESGRVLFSKSPRVKLPMASTTKIMTCLLACELLLPETVVTVTEDTTDIEGSSVYLTAGEKLTVEELLYCAMLRSGNDAAHTLAKACGGSVENFVLLMDLRAKSLGMNDTHFANPSGLPAEDHYTTAYDLALLTRAALGNGEFSKVASTMHITVGGNRYLVNRNSLMASYKGMTGVKTGYTPQAGKCLVTSAERDGVKLIAVTLNDGDQWNDHRKMLNYGFAEFENTIIAVSGGITAEPAVTGGESQKVKASNREDITCILPRGAETVIKTERPALVYAPVKRGDRLCRARIYADGKYLGYVDLYAESDIGNAKTNLFERLFG